MTKLKELKARSMEHLDFREDAARIGAPVRARAVATSTRAELVRQLGTTQSAVARLDGDRVSPSFASLRRYAEATGTRLTAGFVPADH